LTLSISREVDVEYGGRLNIERNSSVWTYAIATLQEDLTQRDEMTARRLWFGPDVQFLAPNPCEGYCAWRPIRPKWCRRMCEAPRCSRLGSLTLVDMSIYLIARRTADRRQANRFLRYTCSRAMSRPSEASERSVLADDSARRARKGSSNGWGSGLKGQKISSSTRLRDIDARQRLTRG
jgi:hypothetical protein